MVVYVCSAILSFEVAQQLYPTLHRPIVSVAIPVYNREELIVETIESVLKSTLKDFEIVLVDDGSTDNTLAVLQQYAQKDDRIRVVPLPKNKGVSNARNVAQNSARGKYIVVLDSDDLLFPRHLEKMVRAMEENPSFDVLKPRFTTQMSEHFPMGPSNYTLIKNEDPYPACLFFYSCYGNSGVIIRRDFIVKNRIRYDKRFVIGEDWDYWLSCVFAGVKMGALKDTLIFVRRHYSLSYSEAWRTGKDGDGIKQKVNNRFHATLPGKYRYTSEETCQLMAEYIKYNEKHNLVEHKTLQKYGDQICPQNKK